MTRTIKTGRQDIYIQYVANAEASRGSDEATEEDESPSSEDASDDSDYFFQYQYELFSFAAILGYLQDEQAPADGSYGQDIRKVEDMSEDDPHREAIDFITRVVQVAEDVEENEAWEEVLRYADAGVEYFDDEVDNELDFVRFVEDASNELWEDRFEETIGTPSEFGTL